jgi:hypothetical protein
VKSDNKDPEACSFREGWAQRFADGGFRYIVLEAKHVFTLLDDTELDALFQLCSRVTNRIVGQVEKFWLFGRNWEGGDQVKELMESFLGRDMLEPYQVEELLTPSHGQVMPGGHGRWCESCGRAHGIYFPCESYSAEVLLEIQEGTCALHQQLRESTSDIPREVREIYLSLLDKSGAKDEAKLVIVTGSPHDDKYKQLQEQELAKEEAVSCDAPGCDRGWIHHQHPMKPPGVIINSTPCQQCNADRSKPFQSGEMRFEIKLEGDEDA